jgi:hypothetical protein
MFDPIASAVDTALLSSPMAQTVTYQRPVSGHFDAVGSFAISAIPTTSGDFASPEGPIYADVFLQTATIPLGPQKGDQVTISDGAVQDGTYLVQQVFWDRRAGSAHLKVRWTGQ